MARDSEFQRERKKKQLRQSMVTNDKVRSAPVSWAEDHRRTVNVAGIVVAVLVLAVVLAWFVAERLWRYKTYEVSWRTDVSNASSAGYVSYGDGIVVMNKDGATYYDKKGTKVWSAPYDMSNPKANVKGDYLLIYDLKGKNFAICNKSGITGSGTTSHKGSDCIDRCNCASVRRSGCEFNFLLSKYRRGACSFDSQSAPD